MAELLTLARIRRQDAEKDLTTARRLAKRDALYFNFRYANGTYKARKAMLRPFLMVAKRGLSELRLYDDGSHQPTKIQEMAMRDKCKGWRQKERELKKQNKSK